MLTTTTPKASDHKAADHTVHVHPAEAAAVPADMKVGQTVSFSSTAGEVEIDFQNGWPFDGSKHPIHSGEVLTVKKGGDYKFACKIKKPGETTYAASYYGGEMKPR